MGKRTTIALKVLGIVLASVALLIGGALTALRTSWGGERLRRILVSRVNNQIEGHLEIERLSFKGNQVIVFNVMLRDPEGGVVAHVARAEVDVSLGRLLRKEVRVTDVAIDTPNLDLVSGAAGLNLSRATAARKKSPPKAPHAKTTEDGWVIRLDRFRLAGGSITFFAGGAANPDTKLHLADLRLLVSARYATGNGNLDLTIGLDGQSVQAPTGPLRLNVDAHVRGTLVRLRADGNLLGGALAARANVDTQHLAGGDAGVNMVLPRLALAGHEWGPMRIEGEAHPGAIPKLDLLIDIPGVELTGKGGGAEGTENGPARRFDFTARLALRDLTATGAAVRALTGGELPPLGGSGTVDLSVGGPMAGAPASWNGLLKGLIPELRVGETVVNGVAVQAHAARLAAQPEDATLALTVASLRAGTTPFHGIDITAAWKQRNVTADVKLAGPQASRLGLQARLDDDNQGLTLRMSLAFPGTEWTSDTSARLRFGGDALSLENFSLVSQEQSIALDGEKVGHAVTAHLALAKLRLERLPAWAVNPSLRLGGLLGLDVRVSGAIDNPRAVAALRLEQGRVQGFSKLGITANVTLADQRVDGTLGVGAPFLDLDAKFKLPADPGATDAPVDVRVDVARLNVGEALRAVAAHPVRGDGHVAIKLRLAGSAQSPTVDATVTGKDLQVATPPAVSAKAPPKVDVGNVRVRLTYAERLAKLKLVFSATEGGTVDVDADSRVDLSYPGITRGIVVAKLPVRGKVVAKNLDVAWISQFSDRLQTVAGQVNADARLAGTLADPQFIGDVRWKNGKLIATAAEPPPPRSSRAAARP
ncbi:MAG TPA: hypothetical protein VGP07_03150 [Polyangia bacterium]